MTAFTRKRKVLAGALLAGVLAAAGVLGAVAAFSNDNETEPPDRNGNDTPIGHEVDAPADRVSYYTGLHEARLDLAERLGIDPADIRLTSVSHAGFNGCMGIHIEDQACTEQLIAATIALFQTGGETYRYHIGDGQIIATDFVEGDAIDGLELDPEMMPDTNALLAAYARGDLAIRLGVEIEDIVGQIIQPVSFPNLCLGFQRDLDEACDDAIAYGAIVVAGQGEDSYRYHVSSHGIVFIDYDEGEPTIELDNALTDLWHELRADLADRLGVDMGTISAVSFKHVLWPDGCMGVYYKDSLCSQAIVEGFTAVLSGPGDDTGYIYHGADQEFIAVSFLDPDEVRFGAPLAGDPTE